jgi:hypothetical protein
VRYFLAFCALVFVVVIADGFRTGVIMAKYGPGVSRRDRPVLFYLLVVAYLAIAALAARFALLYR